MRAGVKTGRKLSSRGGRVLLALGLLCFGLTGCANFFTPNTTSGGNSGNTGTITGAGANAAYVMNATTTSAYGFTISSAGLANVSTSLSLGYVPLAAVVTRAGGFLYVAGSGTINAYVIAGNGSLSVPSYGSSVALASTLALDVSPDGNWLVGLDALSNQLDVWLINSNGTLTTQSPAVYTTSGTVVPKSVKVAPSGGYIFAALGTGGEVVFTFDTTTGVATQSQSLATGSTQTADSGIAVDPTSSYLFVARSGAGVGLSVYTIGSQGLLTLVTGSPYKVGAGASSVAIDGTGKYVYVANRTDGTISGFTLGTGGALTAISGSPFTAGSLVSSLGIDSTGDYLVAASFGGSPDVALYSFDATTPGKLDAVGTAAAGTDPAGSSIVATTH